MSVGISYSWAFREAASENVLVRRAISLGNDPDKVIRSFIKSGSRWLTNCDACDLPRKFCIANNKLCYERIPPKELLEMMYAINGGCWLTDEQDYIWYWEVWPNLSSQEQKNFLLELGERAPPPPKIFLW